MKEHAPAHNGQSPLRGGMLALAALLLALANFLAVLNMTIANVTVPNMAGGLGAGGNQGTWIITAYAVAEAITVPLTGWLSARFGAVRVFGLSVVFFGVFSLFCGLSTSLPMLVLMRVFQGMSGGPLMALSQTLLLRIFPKEKTMQAMGLWAMTTMLAPVIGPVLGGWLADQYNWSWVFYINVPMALVIGWISMIMLKRYELPLEKNPVDLVGMILLVVWVGALQVMLDEGKDLDWFASTKICVLTLVATVGFAAFLIWELTEKHPIVDLRVFRHRGFSACMVVMALAFGAFFGVNVLTPLWLQYNMGYTATWAGMVVAWGGLLSPFCAPVIASLAERFDSRRLIFSGVTVLGVITLWRSVATPDMTYWQISIPLFFMGVGFPLFFIPLVGVSMGAVDESETASASGLMNFIRTISGGFATSMVATAWQNKSIHAHEELAGIVGGYAVQSLDGSGLPRDLGRGLLEVLVSNQSLMLATNELMVDIGLIFLVASVSICLAPKQQRAVDPTRAGH